MKLYLVQHGDSLSKEIDPDRPLSDTGRRDVRRLAEFLTGKGIRVSRVLHSGKTRARETAALLARALAPEEQVEASSDLAPNDPTDWLAYEATQWDRDVLVVGHLPFMEKLVARLVARREDAGIVAYRQGSMVCLERGDDGRWTIAWMLRPELLD